MRKGRAGERGSIYAEALVSVAILAVALLPVFGGFLLGPRVQDETGRRNVALAIARGRLERLHALSGDAWDALPGETSGPDPDNPAYTVTLRTEPRDGVDGLKDVTVAVQWVDGRQRPQSVSLATAVSRRSKP